MGPRLNPSAPVCASLTPLPPLPPHTHLPFRHYARPPASTPASPGGGCFWSPTSLAFSQPQPPLTVPRRHLAPHTLCINSDPPLTRCLPAAYMRPSIFGPPFFPANHQPSYHALQNAHSLPFFRFCALLSPPTLPILTIQGVPPPGDDWCPLAHIDLSPFDALCRSSAVPC
jgi:hypothetical protein